MSDKKWTPPSANKLRDIGDKTAAMLKEAGMDCNYILVALDRKKPGAGSFTSDLDTGYQGVQLALASMAEQMRQGKGRVAAEEN